MDRETLELIDAAVEGCRAKVLEVGDLKRLNRRQRALLTGAFEEVLSLPARLRESSNLGTRYRKESDG